MARLNSTGSPALRSAALAAAATILLAGCTQVLDLKTLVMEKVALSRIGLTLYDGADRILPGETVTWEDTIFGDPLTKTLTLTNDGTTNITLTGPTVVSTSGGSGAAAFGGVTQPVQLTLLPGSSTTFNATYTPLAADSDYVCDFIINSDDSSYPAYTFKGAGHSTQWHGSKAIVSSTSFVGYYSPQIAVAPAATWASPGMPTLMVAYHGGSGIYLSISRDGGKTWPEPKLAVSSTFVTALSLSVSTNVHLFYLSSSPAQLNYTIAGTSTLISSVSSDYTSYFATNYVGPTFPNSHFYQVKNSNMAIVDGYVYVAYYNTTSSRLQVARRPDSIPFMGQVDFDSYDITGVNSQTGGNDPSLQVDSSKLYVSYGDGQYTRVAVVPLSTIATTNSYQYHTINDNGSGRSLWSCGLAMDGSKGYVLWRLDGGSPINSAASTDMSMSSWSAVHALAGETTPTISAAQTTPLMFANDRLYTVYFRDSSGSGSGIRLASTSDGGITWLPQWLDSDASFASSASEVAMASLDSTIYVVYTTQSSSHPNKYSITLKKSLDGGVTW
jgi:hypothetical protein